MVEWIQFTELIMLNGILQKHEITKLSQPVTDIKSQVIPHIERMTKLCNQKIGKYPGAVALAHCQVEKENPLTFFVFKDGETIINPEIIENIGYSEKSSEGCLSLALRPEKKINRCGIIRVRYLNGYGETIIMVESGKRAFVFQHEIDHFRNKYIY